MKKGLRRVAAVAVTALVVAPALATVASATPTFAFDRLAGPNRYDTSVKVAEKYGTSTNVILASGVPGHYPDALTASYLAGFAKAPIMLTQLAATPTNVVDRITASGATDVWLIGGTGVISAAQETALDAKFGTIHRLGGLDRYLTAEKVIGAAGVAKSTTAVLATGVNFPDAIAGGPLSYVKGMPLAITATNSVPAATLRALKAAGTTKVIVLGGPTIITPAVLATLAAQTPSITLDQRIFGANRSETSSKLADYLLASQGFTKTGVNVASGYAFGTGADALGGASLSGKEVRPTLITESVTNVGPGPVGFLKANCATLADGHIFGGVGAVSTASQTEMTAAGRCVVGSNQTFTVTPNTAAVVPFAAAPAAANTRTYTATVPAGTVVDIALFAADNVTVSASGVVTFADATGTANVADVGTLGGAIISSVNGVANTGATFNDVTSTGTITFSVTSTGAGSVVPVVFDKADANNVLDLVAPATANANPKQPTDAFGIGGAITFVPAQAGLGSSTPTIFTVDTTLNYFTSAGAGAATYNWDANDTFQFGGVAITQAQFESVLNPTDVLAVAYNPSAAGVSVFNVNTDKVLVPGTPVAVVKNLDGGATINDVQVTFRPNADAASGDTYTLLEGTTPVAGATQAAGTTAGTIVFTKLNASGTSATPVSHTYIVEADSALGTASNSATASAVTVPGTADTLRPTSVLASLITDVGLAGDASTGDVFTFRFSEPMAAPAAGATIRMTDGNATPTVADVINGTNATFALNAAAITTGVNAGAAAGEVLTVTLTAAPSIVTAGSLLGLQYPATVTTSGGITDVAGNTWNVATAAVVQASAVIAGVTAVAVTDIGAAGNALSIVIVTGATGAGNLNRPLAAAQAGNVITVTLGTDAGGATLATTATAVAAVVDPLASVSATGTAAAITGAVPSVSFTGGSNGSDVTVN